MPFAAGEMRRWNMFTYELINNSQDTGHWCIAPTCPFQTLLFYFLLFAHEWECDRDVYKKGARLYL